MRYIPNGKYEQNRHIDIFEGLRENSPEAIEYIVNYFGKDLTQAAYIYLGDRYAADDVVQETFIAACSSVHRTSSTTRLREWIFGILFNQCKKYRRSIWRRRKREKIAVENYQHTNHINQDQKNNVERLRQALKKLNPIFKTVIILRFKEGMSITETAKVLGVPEGTVKSRTSSAIKILRVNVNGIE